MPVYGVWGWRVNIKLKPIAESKVRQLGGDVCGVLVRKDEKLAAVDEHGRVQWLHGDSEHTAYLEGMNAHLRAELKAARAQGAQGAEAVAWASPLPDGTEQVTKELPERIYGVVPKDYQWYVCPLVYADTQPQPAVPEGWRECLQEMVQAMYDYEMSVEEDAPYKHRAMMDRAHALLSTPTTPQADEWGGLIDRLANKAETENISVEVVFDDGYMREKFDTDISEHVANWLRGLKRPQPPAGQEESGDE
jgi:hypothetical protein